MTGSGRQGKPDGRPVQSQGADVAHRLLAFMTAPTAGAAQGVEALLDEHASFAALGRTGTGARAVAEILCDEAVHLPWRRLQWQSPVPVDTGVRLVGEPVDGALLPGLIVTLQVRDGRVTRIEQQRSPPRPPAATGLRVPDDLRELVNLALEQKQPMLMAHVDESGHPVLSYRGSAQVHADDQLAMWIRNRDGAFMRAIRSNPHVAFMYRHEQRRASYQFQGRARVSQDAEETERVYQRCALAERAHDFARLGVAVIVDLDRIEGYAGVGPDGQVGRIHMVRGA